MKHRVHTGFPRVDHVTPSLAGGRGLKQAELERLNRARLVTPSLAGGRGLKHTLLRIGIDAAAGYSLLSWRERIETWAGLGNGGEDKLLPP